MTIIQRVPWTAQPQTAARVNAGNSFATGLQTLWLPGSYDAVSGTILATPETSGSSRVVGSKGRALATDGSTFVSFTPAHVLTATELGQPYTVAAYYKSLSDTWAAFSGVAAYTDSVANSSFSFLQGDSSNLSTYHNATAGPSGVLNTTLLPVNKYVFVVQVWTGSTLTIYADGVLKTTGALVAAPGTTGPPNRWRLGSSRDVRHTGEFALFCHWVNRALTGAEVANLSRNPWQLFAPLPRRIWAAAAAGPPPTFIPSWAYRKTRTIGAGVI